MTLIAYQKRFNHWNRLLFRFHADNPRPPDDENRTTSSTDPGRGDRCGNGRCFVRPRPRVRRRASDRFRAVAPRRGPHGHAARRMDGRCRRRAIGHLRSRRAMLHRCAASVPCLHGARCGPGSRHTMGADRSFVPVGRVRGVLCPHSCRAGPVRRPVRRRDPASATQRPAPAAFGRRRVVRGVRWRAARRAVSARGPCRAARSSRRAPRRTPGRLGLSAHGQADGSLLELDGRDRRRRLAVGRGRARPRPARLGGTQRPRACARRTAWLGRLDRSCDRAVERWPIGRRTWRRQRRASSCPASATTDHGPQRPAMALASRQRSALEPCRPGPRLRRQLRRRRCLVGRGPGPRRLRRLARRLRRRGRLAFRRRTRRCDGRVVRED